MLRIDIKRPYLKNDAIKTKEKPNALNSVALYVNMDKPEAMSTTISTRVHD